MDLVRRSTGWRQGAFAPAVGLLLLTAASAPALAQTNIDTFTTNQATLSAPPDSSSTATGGADIIGTRRGIVVHNLSGAGPTTVAVASGALTLTVTNTTPDSRGEARLSWDGDTNATTLSPTGLGGINLTTGGASGFRVRVNSSSVANAELEMTVHTNATSSSRLGRVLPLVGAPQNFFLPFAEFIQAGTSAANFGSVGAIELTVRTKDLGATAGTVVIDEIVTTLPSIAATKTDALIIDNDSDLKADPGDRVRYTVTITNTGNQATSVDLTDTVDANTTLVAGSVSSTPVAHNDQYLWFGNVTLSVDGTPSQLLLANDTDGDGDTVTISTFDATTAQGGSVTGVNVNTGEFTYTPPAGFRGVDSFNYTIVDNDAHTATAAATITLSGMVWFVDDSNTTPPHLGTLADPFQTLASVNGTDPDEPGDIIFLYDDDGTPYAGGMTLEANQEFVGQGVGLTLGGNVIVAAGGTPQITNAAGVGLTLATDNTVRGLDVQNTSGTGIFGNTFGTLTASSISVTGTGGSALDLATGNLAATFGTLSSTGAGLQRGIQLVTVTGSMTVTTTSLTNPTTQGIRVASSPAVVLDFGNTTITDNVIGTAPAATGIDVATGNAGAAFTFDSLSVTTDAGAGLLANGSGTINIGGTTNTIDATGGAAVDITSTSLGSGATFSTLTSTNSTGKGVNLDTVTGSVTANGGSISGPAGIAFDLNAGSSNVTYTGAISNTANARLIEVTGRTGGTVTFSGNLSSTSNGNGINVANNNVSGSPVINFSGGTKTLNTGTDPAVTLDNNDVATINFTGGGLDIDTTSGAGFTAINGAVAVTVQGTGNSIFANGTGTALNVVASTIGGSGLTFQSISAGTGASGPASGIILNNTGSGALTVTGTGSAGTGGTIQHTTSHGLSLTTASNVSLNNVSIHDTGDHGIFGDGVNNLSFTNSTIFNFGNALPAAGASEDAMHFESTNTANTAAGHGLTGTVTIQNVTIGPDGHFSLTPFPPLPENKGIVIRNHNDANLNMTVTTSTFTQISNDGIDGEVTDGDATLNVTGNGAGLNNFSQINGRAVVFTNPVDNAVAHTVTVSIVNNTFNLVGIGGRWLASGRCTVNATYSGNSMTSTTNDAIRSESDAVNAASTPHATVNATVNSNIMGGGSVFISNHRQAVSTITFSNNTNIGGTAAGVGGAGSTGVHTGINVRSDRGSTVNVDFLSNTGTADGSLAFAQSALDFQATDNGGGASTICARVNNNNLTENPDTAGQQVISIDPAHAGTTIRIEGGPGGSPGTENFLIANNTLNGTNKVAISDPSRVPSGVGFNCVP